MRKILLPGVVVLHAVAGLGADVVNDNFEVHLSFAAKTFDIGHEVTLIGADGTAQSVVILKRGPESKWEDSGTVEAARDHAGVIAGGRLGLWTGDARGILMEMFRNYDG